MLLLLLSFTLLYTPNRCIQKVLNHQLEPHFTHCYCSCWWRLGWSQSHTSASKWYPCILLLILYRGSRPITLSFSFFTIERLVSHLPVFLLLCNPSGKWAPIPIEWLIWHPPTHTHSGDSPRHWLPNATLLNLWPYTMQPIVSQNLRGFPYSSPKTVHCR